MLIMDRSIGTLSFTTAEDPTWRMVPSHDGIEDTIHHGGRFLSITYMGHVEAWQRKVETSEFTSDAVAREAGLQGPIAALQVPHYVDGRVAHGHAQTL